MQTISVMHFYDTCLFVLNIKVLKLNTHIREKWTNNPLWLNLVISEFGISVVISVNLHFPSSYIEYTNTGSYAWCKLQRKGFSLFFKVFV